MKKLYKNISENISANEKRTDPVEYLENCTAYEHVKTQETNSDHDLPRNKF